MQILNWNIIIISLRIVQKCQSRSKNVKSGLLSFDVMGMVKVYKNFIAAKQLLVLQSQILRHQPKVIHKR